MDNDKTRDLAIRIVELVNGTESEWDFDLQDRIHDLINDAVGVKDESYEELRQAGAVYGTEAKHK